MKFSDRLTVLVLAFLGGDLMRRGHWIAGGFTTGVAALLVAAALLEAWRTRRRP